MSSNGGVGGPEDMQVESTTESNLKAEGASERHTGLSNNVADISGM